MKYKTICKLEEIIGKLNDINIMVLSMFFIFFIWTFVSLRKVYHWIKRIGNKDAILPEDIFNEYASRLKCHETGSNSVPHNRKSYTGRLKNTHFFHKDRKYNMSFTTMVYVENEYNERMHRFFEERRDEIEQWSEWHGWKIVFADKETIKEGMFFPQDYDTEFRHGFLWCEKSSSPDPEYDVFGDVHSYFEIEPDTDDAILEQMNRIMSKIYRNIDWKFV